MVAADSKAAIGTVTNQAEMMFLKQKTLLKEDTFIRCNKLIFFIV